MQRANGGSPKSVGGTALHTGAAGQNTGGRPEAIHREKHLARNRSGKYEIRWTERDPETGRTRTRSLSTHTDDDHIAQAVMRRTIQDERREALTAGGVSLGVLLSAYRAAIVARGVGTTQLGALQRLGEFWGDLVITDVTPEAVGDYRETRGVSSGTLRRELNALVACLRWSVRHHRIPVAPPIDLPAEGTPRAVFLEEKLEQELWDLAVGHCFKPSGRMSRVGRFIAIGLDTGARKAAIEGLTWDRVDLTRGTIDFRDPRLRVTKKRRVVTPITARLMPVLARAYAEKNSAFVLDMGGAIKTAFQSFMDDFGFEGVTPHTLKHTRITLLLRAGVPPWDVSALTGTSVATILSVYGHHVTDDRLRAAANRRAPFMAA
jgi:integrase